MSNWVKKVVQKRNEQKKAEKKEGKNIKKKGNILCAVIVCACALSFVVLSFKNYSPKMGYALAIFSLSITIFFEIYEWIILSLIYRKSISNKGKEAIIFLKDYPLLFAIPSIIILFILIFIIYFTNFLNYNHSNIVSSSTICIYIISMLSRKIYSINKEK